MGNGDNRHGDRWQDRGDGGRWDRERSTYGDWGSERGGNRGRQQQGEDRGFFERAGEQVRSWFSDDDERARGYERGRGESGRGGQSFGGGFGNQRGWGDDHFDRQYGSRSGQPGQGREGFEGGRTSFSSSGGGGGGGGAEPWGGSGFGGPDDNGRRFDRIDAGHVGAQGAHPMSAPTDSGYGGYGAGGSGSSARSAAIMANARGGQHGGQRGGGHDPHYSEWRQRQIEQLDRDYDEYRREHQSRFEQDFGGWREKRQTQRQHLGRVGEQMEVIGSDGEHVGTVDKVRGDRIILTKSDPNAGGVHHSIPCSWIESCEDRVTINKTAAEAMKQWESEEQNRALFERGDEGSEGPHMLNRSFSGTYTDRDS